MPATNTVTAQKDYARLRANAVTASDAHVLDCAHSPVRGAAQYRCREVYTAEAVRRGLLPAEAQ